MKKMRRMLSCLLMLVVLLTNSISVLAVDQERQKSGDEQTPVEIGAYVDEGMPEKILNKIDMQEVPSTSFLDYGKAYQSQGIYLEWEVRDESATGGFVATSVRVENNENTLYHGLGCGSTEKKVFQVMKEQGWRYLSKNVQASSDIELSFYKKTEQSVWEYQAVLTEDKVIKWSWLNWVQGDIGFYPYKDVTEESWYYSAVHYVHQKYLMLGKENFYFAPAENIARAQFANIMYRMNNEPEVKYEKTFLDVADHMWYTDAILWTAKEGVTTGYTGTELFGPADPITREQMATMMYRYGKKKEYDMSQKADYSKFMDSKLVSEFAGDAMKWAVGAGIIEGKDGGTRLDPQGHANRAECAMIIMRFLEKYVK